MNEKYVAAIDNCKKNDNRTGFTVILIVLVLIFILMCMTIPRKKNHEPPLNRIEYTGG
jgi:competence protein ComGC